VGKSLLAWLALAVVACGGEIAPWALVDGGPLPTPTVTTPTGTGTVPVPPPTPTLPPQSPPFGPPTLFAPCVFGIEADPTFTGFDESQISVDVAGHASGDLVCVANHFRGRATCPYGQDANGKDPKGAGPCQTTKGASVTGGQVSAQCTDRQAHEEMVWSCRCANAHGLATDGDNYCTCADGVACTQLVPPTGDPNDHVSGGYCLKDGRSFDPKIACMNTCDPSSYPCK
jgi:hypothetical protein